MDNSSNNKRIAKNTLFLYIRMFLLMVISLYTSRVILNALGVVDYGLYNVVGGVVTMFSMISGSLSTAIGRFLTYSLGKKEKDKLPVIFSTSVNIQIGLSVIIIIFAETIGLWFLNSQMTIPPDRLSAANWVYQFSIATFVVHLISIPYNSTIIAHERMSAFAYISLFEAVGKLSIAFLISLNPFDRLIFFSLLTVLLSFIIRLIYGWYCRIHFAEARFRLVFDIKLLKEMSGFAGWNFLGSSAMILREHGGNLIINLFCGPAVNAARAIATKVNVTVQSFIQNFMMAINPQITKSYAQGDFDYMFKIMQYGAKLSFYLMLLISIPIMFDIDYILKVWLVTVPEHTSLFVCLILILAMSDILSEPLKTAILATGHVKNYQIAVGTLQLLNIPISYMLLREGIFPEIVIVVSIIISNVALFLRLYMLRKIVPIEVGTYLRKVYLNAFLVSLPSLIVPVAVSLYIPSGPVRFMVIVILSTSASLASVYYVGLDNFERTYLKEKISRITRHHK